MPEVSIRPPRKLVRHARRTLERRGAGPIVQALRLLDQSAASGDDTATESAREIAWTAAGLGHELSHALSGAHRQTGRLVVDLVFTFHSRLGQGNPPAQHHTRLEEFMSPIAMYDPWIRSVAESRSPWRQILIRWVDVMSERLTMHRYTDPRRRRLHAEALLARPLRLFFNEAARNDEATEIETAFCEQALAFWDLTRAERQREWGWNRVEAPQGPRMGGFYGLADEARPPTPDALRKAAGELAAALESATPRPSGAVMRHCLVRLRDQMQPTLEEYARTGRWPSWIERASQSGVWARLIAILRKP